MPEQIPDTPRCRACGKVPPKVLEQTWEDWEAMEYCDQACRRQARWSRSELVTEVEFLVGTDTPANIAQRLGYKPGSLARRLHRMGRLDIATRFYSAA